MDPLPLLECTQERVNFWTVTQHMHLWCFLGWTGGTVPHLAFLGVPPVPESAFMGL